MAYTLDWDSANLDGDNNLNDGSEGVTVKVTTPDNGGWDFNITDDNIGQGTLEATLVNAPNNEEASVLMNFEDGNGNAEAVQNVSFDLYDVDSKLFGPGYDWDDIVTIIALDANGNQVTVSITHSDGQIVFGNTVEGTNNDTSNGATVHVEIAGPIVSLEIVFTDGPDHSNAGWIGIGDITFNEFVFCFTKGTQITTNRGEVAIEDLVEGDMVRTLDNGMQPIRWIGSTKVSASGNMAPILFAAGSIGNTRDLQVSPAHRVLLEGWKTELLFGDAEMLTAAKSLVNGKTITQPKGGQVEYFHILFDKHEIIFSDGAMTESFHPGEAGQGVASDAARAEIFALFPHLEDGLESFGPAVRSVLNTHEVALLNA
ncbi:MAG: Hint domain-containing protein [Rhodobacteraceae bacterium]|nr:Hint domain-containing protein [Paracoccaceae bacterium]